MKKPPSLGMQILFALLLGMGVGLLCYFLPGAAAFTAAYVKPLGDIFIDLLKFIVVPVVLFSMIDGIVSMQDLKKVGSVGLKSVAFFFVTTALACVIALAVAQLFHAVGAFPALDPAGAAYEMPEYGGFLQTLTGIIPTNLWRALSDGNMLQVILIAVLFGSAILAAGEQGSLCARIVRSFYSVVERLMLWIIRLAPIGVFAYMTWVVATQGAAVLGSLALVLLCAYAAYGLHLLLVYAPAVTVLCGLRPLDFFRKIFPAMIFAFTSASSAATLPVSKACAHDLGGDETVTAFVLPLGATINMDGTAIYQCVATVFLAACAGIDLTLGQMIVVILTATLSSVGTAGVSGAGLIMLAMTLEAIHIPVSYIGLIVAVDRLFDMGRTCLNVAGDLSCTVFVSRWETKKNRS